MHAPEKKRRELHKRQHGACAICGAGISLHGFGDQSPTLDHIIPKSKGGASDIKNLRLAHKACNETRANEVDTVSKVIGGWRVLRYWLA